MVVFDGSQRLRSRFWRPGCSHRSLGTRLAEVGRIGQRLVRWLVRRTGSDFYGAGLAELVDDLSGRGRQRERLRLRRREVYERVPSRQVQQLVLPPVDDGLDVSLGEFSASHRGDPR